MSATLIGLGAWTPVKQKRVHDQPAPGQWLPAPQDGAPWVRSRGHHSQHPIYCLIYKWISLVCLHLPLTRLMLHKQPLSLIHLIYVIVLPWLRQGKTSSAASSKDNHLLIFSSVSKPKGFITTTGKYRAQQLSGICCSMLTFSKVHSPNGISSSKSKQMERGTVGNTPGSRPDSYQPSLTLWRPAGRNQEGQDALLMLMRATVTY